MKIRVVLRKPDYEHFSALRIVKDGISLFKRYGPDGAWYHKFNAGGKQRLIKLTHNAAGSAKLAKKLHRAAAEGRWDVLAAVQERHVASSLADVLLRYEANARGATGISAVTVRYTLSAVKTLFRVTGQGWEGPSTRLDAALCEKYKAALLAAAGADKQAQDRAVVTANSVLRQARSLFSQKLPADFYAGLVLPDVAALRAVRLLPEPSKGFIMPAPELLAKIRAAAPDLKKSDPNAYLIYLLSLTDGLRAGEIAAARPRWIEAGPDGHILRVQTEADFRPKSNQQRAVPLSGFVHGELQELIIPTVPPEAGYMLRGNKTEREVRAFARFGVWLQSLGWERRKKAHEFRKIFGSHVCHQAGMRAAQEVLGHASFRTTEEYYVGSTELPKYQIPA